MDNGELRLWIRDGDTNALICMDKSDTTELIKQLKKHVNEAPEEVESFDFNKPISRKKVTTTSAVVVKKKRKQRSDKGRKRGPQSTPLAASNFDKVKEQKIAEALS